MSAQRIIAIVLLLAGAAYAVVTLLDIRRNMDVFRNEKGKFSLFCVWEFIVYFFSTLGISDFLLNTIYFQRACKGDDKRLPGTLATGCLFPCVVIAFFLLQTDEPVSLKTLIPCSVAVVAGSMIGAKLVGKLDGRKIRKFLGYALIASMAALIVKIIVSRGTPGTLTGVTGWKLIFATVFCFLCGVVNMLGVPSKPAQTAMFLLMGVSPIHTLTIVLGICSFGPFGGVLSFVKSGEYHHKMVCAAIFAGTVGAVLGSLFAISLNAAVLNVILIAVMLVAIISIFREKGGSAA